jgi:hypothetical protein
MPEGNLRHTLRLLSENQVDFILVGGLAAVLQGVPVSTFDVDIVHSRDVLNIQRLMPVLETLDAVFRMQPERRLKPNARHLSGLGHVNLVTRLGSLDLLCTIGDGLSYEQLLPYAESMNLENGLEIRVLGLEKLIELKEQLGGEKDRAMLPLLRRALEEKRRG